MADSRQQRHTGPDFAREQALADAGRIHVAGVDEAGRGPLAGPVVAAAVILSPATDGQSWWRDVRLDDSKAMTAERRAKAHAAIMQHALAVSTASVSAQAIDASDIRKASLTAMARAVAGLALAPDAALFDGRDVPDGLDNQLDAQSVIGGDGRCLSIAAASVIAKVTRDRMMEMLCETCPVYGLSGHKGYGSARHRQAIADHGGVVRVHRFSFRPLRAD